MALVTIDIADDTIDSLLIDRLQEIYLQLKEDLDLRKQGLGIPVYDADDSRDILLIHKKMEAYASVLEDLGVGDPDFQPS
jgi:hypothetical protein